jgi:small-conductance mechanosensitive channel
MTADTSMPDPQSFKQLIDCIGYSVMGLVGLFGAWQRMRAVTASVSNRPSSDKGEFKKIMPLERLERAEQDIQALRNRQAEIHQETIAQHNAILKQQAAMFDLLVQQRSALDKILAKMGGLT